MTVITTNYNYNSTNIEDIIYGIAYIIIFNIVSLNFKI